MENSITEFLENYNIKYDLSHSYINKIFTDLKQYLLFLNYKRYKLTKKNITNYIYKYFNQNLNILQSVINISKIKQPEQRSPEWFAIRYKIISASDASSILGKNIQFISDSERSQILFKNGFKSKKDLIKVKILKEDSFTGNVYTEHGVIFEEVASLIYQKRNNTNVIDFGLVLHPTINFLGASPDGITQNGIMLEIKCPYKRNLTNQVPSNYWVQMQLQLECCNLEICHFVEIKVQFYDNNIDYYNDTSPNDPLYTLDNLEKGILIKYENENNKNTYVYPPYNIYKNNDSLENWSKDTFDYYNTKYTNVEFKYWKITQYSLIEVKRDVNWFKQTLPIFKEFWDKVLFYKDNLEAFNKDIIKTEKTSKSKSNDAFDQLQISDSDEEANTPTKKNVKKTIKKKQPPKQFTDKIIFHSKNTSPKNTSPNIIEILQENIQNEVIQDNKTNLIQNSQTQVIENSQTQVIENIQKEVIENIQTEVIKDNKTQDINDIAPEQKNISKSLNIDIDDIEDDL